MARRKDLPQSSEERRAFLQRRIAGFGRILAGFVASFYVIGNGVAMLHPRATWADFVSPLNRLVLAAAVVASAQWLTCRNTKRSIAELEGIDAVGTIAIGTLLGITPIWAPPVQRPELSAIMGVILFVTLRAIVIPSEGSRSALLSSLASLPAIYGAYACHAAEPATSYTLPLPLYPALTAMWAGLGVLAATLASRTIFGLRRRASEAQKLGQYTLGEKIGEGGMGAVYRASHALMKREVAIKLLPPERSGDAAIRRFEREVQLTSRLTSPNTIAIYDYGRTADGVFYYVMEFIDGYSLEDLVSSFGALPPGRVIRLCSQICVALAEAHDIGLIHRDIKPANIAVCERAGEHDVVKVLDFGLVKELGTDVSATATAMLTGTPLYLAPEAITSPERVDGRTDLYALGAVAYYLLTGTHVFGGSTIVEVCSHHLTSVPESPSQRRGSPVPRALEGIVLRCLAKKAEDRFPDARALRDAFAACDESEEWTEVDAAAWWRTNRERVERPKFEPSRAPSHLDVDLGGSAIPS
jgi:eukaryotic-like serine/threonine-protein kinase